MNYLEEDIYFTMDKIIKNVSEEKFNNEIKGFDEENKNRAQPVNSMAVQLNFKSTTPENDYIKCEEQLLNESILDAMNKYEHLYDQIENLKDACAQTNFSSLSTVDRQCQCNLEESHLSVKKIKLSSGESSELLIKDNQFPEKQENYTTEYSARIYFKKNPRLRVGLSKRYKVTHRENNLIKLM